MLVEIPVCDNCRRMMANRLVHTQAAASMTSDYIWCCVNRKCFRAHVAPDDQHEQWVTIEVKS